MEKQPSPSYRLRIPPMTLAIGFTISSLAFLASSLRFDPFLLDFAISSSSSIAALIRLRIPPISRPFPLASFNQAQITPSRHANAPIPLKLARNAATSEKKYCEHCRHVIYLSKIAYHTVHYDFPLPPPPLVPSSSQLGFIFPRVSPNLLIA